MNISPNGVALIRAAENCARHLGAGKFAAYPDPASGGAPWTIGWGSTGPDIKPHTIWTQAQCDARQEADLAARAAQISQFLGPVPTTQNQFDALMSLAYNIGVGGEERSSVMRLHKAGDHAGAAAAFLLFDEAAHKVEPGLTRRRKAEATLYATPDGSEAIAAIIAIATGAKP